MKKMGENGRFSGRRTGWWPEWPF